MISMMMALAMAGDGAALAPTGKWDVQYADSMCVASRAFGPAADSVVFGIRPWPRSDTAEIFLVIKEAAGKAASGKGSILLTPGEAIAATYSSVSNKAGERVTQLRVASDDIARLAGATTVTIIAGKETATLAPSGVPAVLTALKPCSADLQKRWGIDPGEDALIATEAKRKGGAIDWNSGKYPPEALALQAQGTTTIVWTIGTDGRVSQCRVAVTSGDDSLDAASCAKVKSARYTPAIGKNGKPMESHSTARVTWVLP